SPWPDCERSESETNLHTDVDFPSRPRRSRLAEERRRHDAGVSERVDVVEQVRRRGEELEADPLVVRAAAAHRAEQIARAAADASDHDHLSTARTARGRRPLTEPERVGEAGRQVPHAVAGEGVASYAGRAIVEDG